MSGLAIIGAQWGDEGKGKIVDLLTEQADVVARFQGGNNAGHTLVVDGHKTVLHLIPSGILHPRVTCVVGPGVVLDLEVFIKEIDALRERNLLPKPEHLLVSDSAHIILPTHKRLDALREKNLGDKKIGTTGRGIGPCYEDKVGRRGLRIGDLFSEQSLNTKLKETIAHHNEILTKIYGESPEDFNSVKARLIELSKMIAPHVRDTSLFLYDSIKAGKKLLFEGAQGTELDIDHGTYPFVTSSNTVSGAAAVGSGLGPSAVARVIGVTKAYCTRVGSGPFPTEMLGADGDDLRKKGNEFGSTTGRPRRCGHLDLVALRHAVRVNGLTGLVITKLDTLAGIDKLKIAVRYRLGDQEINDVPTHGDTFARCEPVYEEFPGWHEDLSSAKTRQDLPATCQNYLHAIERHLGVPVVMASVGVERSQVITLAGIWPKA